MNFLNHNLVIQPSWSLSVSFFFCALLPNPPSKSKNFVQRACSNDNRRRILGVSCLETFKSPQLNLILCGFRNGFISPKSQLFSLQVQAEDRKIINGIFTNISLSRFPIYIASWIEIHWKKCGFSTFYFTPQAMRLFRRPERKFSLVYYLLLLPAFLSACTQFFLS